MTKRVSRLTLEHLRRCQAKRYELKKTLLRSLIENHNNLAKLKTLWGHRLKGQPLVSTISRQNSLCIVTGRARGVMR